VVVPADVRAALAAHAEEEAPNEACGLVVVRDGVAERYVRGRNAAASPYRFELDVVSDRLSPEVLSLPMHPYHEAAVQPQITRAVIDAL
jgi:proteasome lid subunit RPN8/RPN11